MDEVDFTILAATSVLGDLIEKCPPAEACRDAFDRMSKATVQMCLSTTGFGASAVAAQGGLNSRRRSQHQSHSEPRNLNPSQDYFDSERQYRQPRAHQSQTSRPKTQFDMGFNDLLSQAQSPPSGSGGQTPQSSFRPPSQNTSNSNVKMELDYTPSPTSSGLVRQNTTQSQSNNQTTIPSPRSPFDSAISPPLSSLDPSTTSGNIDPNLLPSPQTQSRGLTNFSYSSTPNQTSSGYQDLSPFPFTSAPGMDFLQSGGWDLSGSSGITDGGIGTAGNGLAYTGDLGMGGMGLGWDESAGHDFSEGVGGVDLFDGFFFGGSGNF